MILVALHIFSETPELDGMVWSLCGAFKATPEFLAQAIPFGGPRCVECDRIDQGKPF